MAMAEQLNPNKVLATNTSIYQFPALRFAPSPPTIRLPARSLCPSRLVPAAAFLHAALRCPRSEENDYFVFLCSTAALKVHRVVGSALGLGFHHEHEDPAPHGRLNSGELYSKVLTAHPPDNRLVDPRRPIVIEKEQRKLQKHSGL